MTEQAGLIILSGIVFFTVGYFVGFYYGTRAKRSDYNDKS